MNKEQKRLLNIIEFTKQIANLNINSVYDCNKHDILCLYENEVLILPSVKLNQVIDDEDIWIEVPRISDNLPPLIDDKLLSNWIKQSKKPDVLPTLNYSIESDSNDIISDQLKDNNDIKNNSLSISNYKDKEHINKLFEIYLSKWKLWANKEKEYSKTRELYKKLYFLKQQLDGDNSNEQLEIVLGIGVVSWIINGKKIQYPLITKTVEIIIDEKTLAIKILPKTTLPMLEIAHFVENNIVGVSNLETVFNNHYKEKDYLSPFEPATFEPILRAGASYLDHSGSYLPDIDSNGSAYRTIPKPEEKLIITDTWVVFARPRTTSILINDLNNFITKLSEPDVVIGGAIGALVTDLSEEIVEHELPSFRGLSMVNAYSNINNDKPIKELYFPLPFNDEQVRIVQMLEHSDGVVVQGPPGTGKTHTIANVICHYLALGKKLLVTSMREHALSVLQEKIPEAIRPLTVGLLSNDRLGMKQFEDSITKISNEILSIDRNLFTQEIKNHEEEIDKLHSSLKNTESHIKNLAELHMKLILIDENEISPLDAAEELVNSNIDISWIPDAINIEDRYTQLFTYDDISALYQAKNEVGKDINYLGFHNLVSILQELPNSNDMVKLHNNLIHIHSIKQKIEIGSIPRLANKSDECINMSNILLKDIQNLIKQYEFVSQNDIPWAGKFINYLHSCYNYNNFVMIDTLKLFDTDLISLEKSRLPFIKLPVEMHGGLIVNDSLKDAIINLSKGKKPFGIKGVFKRKEKSLLSQFSIASNPPRTADDWLHILHYIESQKDIQVFYSRWDALAAQLNLAITTPKTTISDLLECYQMILKICKLMELLYGLKNNLVMVIPSMKLDLHSKNMEKQLLSIKNILEQHVENNKLSDTLTNKNSIEKIITKLPMPIKKEFDDFILNLLGKQKYKDEDVIENWGTLITKLEHIFNLSKHFYTIGRVTSLIEKSGAPKLAKILLEDNNKVNLLTPEIWIKSWRLKRFHTYFSNIHSLDTLRKLLKLRKQDEKRLAETYKKIITKRSWLKLTENANPKVKSALQSFMASVRAIGKGTGKRAFIHRTNARKSLQEAVTAIPCWIMPHYKISEHLPSSLSEFDLVIIDEASQSDLSALPAILRAKKILIVGDDKQVSPEFIGLDLSKVDVLNRRYLNNQVTSFCPQISPERSMYDLFKVVFANSLVMLKEHFRCVGAIIEYSKREFYNHELDPLRLPKKSEILNPPLIDVWVKDGVRDEIKDVNKAEATYIVDEIKKITNLKNFSDRTIGVVSLLGGKQQKLIFEMLNEEISLEKIERHQIACGDARTFQGKEKDIMFISMVVSNHNGTPIAVTRETFRQRFNVALSRARDRMYLVRSLSIDELSPRDELRRSLLEHFINPYRKDETRVDNLRTLCDSPFEIEVYDILTERGYHVTPQVKVGAFRIDLVVEGDSDARLAIECDGDRYHSFDRWEHDIKRQRILERVGWKFWRCFASTFVMKRHEVIADLIATLNELNIYPNDSIEYTNHNYVEKIEYVFSESETSNAISTV